MRVGGRAGGLSSKLAASSTQASQVQGQLQPSHARPHSTNTSCCCGTATAPLQLLLYNPGSCLGEHTHKSPTNRAATNSPPPCHQRATHATPCGPTRRSMCGVEMTPKRLRGMSSQPGSTVVPSCRRHMYWPSLARLSVTSPLLSARSSMSCDCGGAVRPGGGWLWFGGAALGKVGKGMYTIIQPPQPPTLHFTSCLTTH